MRKITSVLIMSLVSIGVSAQNFDKQKMDSLFSKLEERDKAMGSLSIFKDGKEVYSKSIGFADVENGVEANRNTKYRIGSISKTFTAVMIMQMIEEGKLQLDTKLSEFYPEMPNAEKISIRSLLDHSSGLFNFTQAVDFSEIRTSEHSREEMLRLIERNGSAFEPGEKHEYSNTNYILLTFILEDLSGKTYPEILQEQIVDPLELQHTYYGDKIETSSNEAHSYFPGDPWNIMEETHLSIPLGAGGIVSTASDLNRFFIGLFNGKLLNEKRLDEMASFEDVYGLGLLKFPFYETFAYGHNGGIDGFTSVSVYFPKEKVAVSYLSNASKVALNDILLGTLSIYFGKEYEIPEFSDAIQLPLDILERYVGVYRSDEYPDDLQIGLEDEQLTIAEVDGPAYALAAFGETDFRFISAGINLEFNAEAGTLSYTENGKTFLFSRY